jgi:hypothetical protein
VAGDLPIAVAVSNQRQNIEFTASDLFRSQVLSESDCNIRRNTPASIANGTNRFQQIALGRALQDIGSRPSTESPLNRGVSVHVRQYDDARARKFRPQCKQSLHTGGSVKSHERDIGLVTPKFLDCVRSAGSGCDFLRVRLGG